MSCHSTSWNFDESRRLYGIDKWGDRYFDIDSSGYLIVKSPANRAHPGIALHSLIMDLRRRGYPLPALIRFPHILEDRIQRLCYAFNDVIQKEQYAGSYTVAYPIKSNQQKDIITTLLKHGGDQIGLETGSKPELMAALALMKPGMTLVCNGYKDRDYIRLALIARNLGIRCFIIIEKLSEIDLIIEESQRLAIEPLLGIRIRLATKSRGRGKNIDEERAKFGLLACHILAVIERLQQANLSSSLNIIHFHIDSQITNLKTIESALYEAARYYIQLRSLDIPINIINAGGGLGVCYEGSHCDSLNYSMEDYAHLIVHIFGTLCHSDGFPPPDIITESGRSLTAHHALLVTDIVDCEVAPGASFPSSYRSEDIPLSLRSLWDLWHNISKETPVEDYRLAQQERNRCYYIYTEGKLTIQERAQAEDIFYAICRKIRSFLHPSSVEHKKLLETLDILLADKLFLNFSIFQSLPDSWAIGQVFPIIPLSDLEKAPESHVIIQDLTCDSDGYIASYPGSGGLLKTLPIAQYSKGTPYFIAILLTGAYQEILGDMHNLFGRTHTVNVVPSEDGGYEFSAIRYGHTILDMLHYTHFDLEDFLSAYDANIMSSPCKTSQQRRQFLQELKTALSSYTYYSH